METNPQHDVLCPQGHVIFGWQEGSSYKVMGEYVLKRNYDDRYSYSCPVCGDIDVEAHGLPHFNGCVFEPDDAKAVVFHLVELLSPVNHLEA